MSVLQGASEVDIFFAVPKEATTLSVSINCGEFYIDFTPPTAGSGITFSTVGWKSGSNSDGQGLGGGFADKVPLLADDSTISMRVFIDGSVAEGYWLDWQKQNF